MITKIVLTERVPGLNGDDGLIRENYHAAKKRKTKLKILMLEQTGNRHKGKVEVTYTRYAVQLMDWDNHGASFKHIGDALQSAKIIKEDKPSVLVDFNPRQVKVQTRKEQRIEIIIKDRND